MTGGAGYMFGTLFGVLTMGLIQTYIVFDGTLSSWWAKIVIGLLLLGFILLQKGLLRLTALGEVSRVDVQAIMPVAVCTGFLRFFATALPRRPAAATL